MPELLICVYLDGNLKEPARGQPLRAGISGAAALEVLETLNGPGGLQGPGIFISRDDKDLREGSQEKKRIFLLDLDDEGEVVDRIGLKLSGPQEFKDYLARAGVPGLRQLNPLGLDLIIDFDEVQDGFEYTPWDMVDIELSKVVQSQGQQLPHVQQSQEDELALAMQHELRLSGLADDPKLARSLRDLRSGTRRGQYFDAVIMEGHKQSFLGWHLTFAQDVSDLYDLKEAAAVLMTRAASATDGQYAAFRNREIGLCYMAEKVAPNQAERLAAECQRLNILQFTRSGLDISMTRKSLNQPASQRHPLRRADVMIKPASAMVMGRSCFRHAMCTSRHSRLV
ncbi:hypothetical protein WJX74_006909 [Apatococcus lobatus]|uniref:Uncharacterized protein n=1 Tax=Apatococcus lobatus TaxID=904363 RepID=A0AAW1SEW0_9CHLO